VPTSGPPGTPITVSGSSFGAGDAVDVYFDATPLALAVTDGNGSFGGIVIYVPANAAPGPHQVSATWRSRAPTAAAASPGSRSRFPAPPYQVSIG